MINSLKSQLDQQQQLHKNEVQQLKEELRELSEMSRMSKASSHRTTQIKRPQAKSTSQIQTQQTVSKPAKAPQRHTQQNKQQSSQLASSNTFALSNDPVRNLRILQNQVANTFQNIHNGMSNQVSQISTIQQGNTIQNLSADPLIPHAHNYQSQIMSNENIPGDVAFGSGSPVSQYLQTDTIRQLSGQGNIVDIINQSLPKFDSESFICNQNNHYMSQQEMDQRINEIIQQQQESQHKDPPYMNLLKSKQEFNMRMQQKFSQVQSPNQQKQNEIQSEQVYTQLNTAQLNNRDEKDDGNFTKTAINLTGAQHDNPQQNVLSVQPQQVQYQQPEHTSVEAITNNQDNHVIITGYTNSALPIVSALDEQPKKSDSNFVQLNHNIQQPKVISVMRTHTPPPEDNIPVTSAKPTTQLHIEQKRKQMDKSSTMMDERSDDLPINSAILGKNNVTMNTSGVNTSRVTNQSIQSQYSQPSKKSHNIDLDIDKDFYNEYKLQQQQQQQKEVQKSQQLQSQYQQVFSKNQSDSVRPTSSVNRTRSSDYPRVDLSQNNYYNTKDIRYDSYENQETFPASATAEPANDLIDKKLIDSQRLKVSEARLFDSQRVKMDENLKIYDKQAQSIRKTIGCLDEDEYESIIQLLQSSYGG